VFLACHIEHTQSAWATAISATYNRLSARGNPRWNVAFRNYNSAFSIFGSETARADIFPLGAPFLSSIKSVRQVPVSPRPPCRQSE